MPSLLELANDVTGVTSFTITVWLLEAAGAVTPGYGPAVDALHERPPRAANRPVHPATAGSCRRGMLLMTAESGVSTLHFHIWMTLSTASASTTTRFRSAARRARTYPATSSRSHICSPATDPAGAGALGSAADEGIVGADYAAPTCAFASWKNTTAASETLHPSTAYTRSLGATPSGC